MVHLHCAYIRWQREENPTQAQSCAVAPCWTGVPSSVFSLLAKTRSKSTNHGCVGIQGFEGQWVTSTKSMNRNKHEFCTHRYGYFPVGGSQPSTNEQIRHQASLQEDEVADRLAPLSTPFIQTSLLPNHNEHRLTSKSLFKYKAAITLDFLHPQGGATLSEYGRHESGPSVNGWS